MKLKRLAAKAIQRAHTEFRSVLFDVHRSLRSTLTVASRQGVFTVRLRANDAIGRSLYCQGQYELDLMTGAMSFLRSIGKCPPRGQGTLLDVGANYGVISLGMVHTGEIASAVAIEPEPENFALLQRNVAQNRCEDRVLCLRYAVADEPGQLSFELSPTNSGDHRVRRQATDGGRFQESERRVITVPSDTLDQIVERLPAAYADHLAVVWVDVQGYEGYVFEGGSGLLRRGLPVVSEIWPYGLQRAGFDADRFRELARRYWSSYWVPRRGRFVQYPIDVLPSLFQELGEEGGHENVVFLP